MRLVALDLKILVRQLGPVPWVVLALWCLVAAIQEPQFFRRQGLDLQWPASYAGADILSLILCGLWGMGGLSSYYGQARSRLSGAVAVFTCCLAAHATAFGCSALLDLANGSPTHWLAATQLVGRAALIWLPMAVVAGDLARSSISSGPRLAAIAAAFLVLLSINPLSMLEPLLTIDKFVASALATTGTCLLARLGARGAHSMR